MNIRTLHPLWTYRLDRFLVIAIFHAVVCSIAGTIYLYSSATAFQQLNDTFRDFSSKRKDLLGVLEIARERLLTDPEIERTASIRFFPADTAKESNYNPSSFNLEKFYSTFPIEIMDKRDALARKLFEFFQFEEHLRLRVLSDMPTYTSRLTAFLVLITGSFCLALLYALNTVFNPRDVALATKHPEFSVVAIQFMILILTSAGMLVIFSDRAYETISQSGLLSDATRFPTQFNTDMDRLLSNIGVPLLFASYKEGFLSLELVMTFCIVCIFATGTVLQQKVGDAAYFGVSIALVIVFVSLLIQAYILKDIVSPIRFSADVMGEMIRLDRAQPGSVLVISVFVLCFVLGFLNIPFRLPLMFAGYIGTITAFCWIFSTVIGTKVSDLSQFFSLAALILILVIIGEYILKILMRPILYEPW